MNEYDLADIILPVSFTTNQSLPYDLAVFYYLCVSDVWCSYLLLLYYRYLQLDYYINSIFDPFDSSNACLICDSFIVILIVFQTAL